MKINHKLFRMNRNLIICLLVSTAVSTVAAQAMAGYASYINTTVAVGPRLHGLLRNASRPVLAGQQEPLLADGPQIRKA